MPYGRRRFGGAPRNPITQSNTVARKRGKCRACGQYFMAGDGIAVLRLKKRYRTMPCGHTIPGTRRFHTQCLPGDWNAAMGFDPSTVSTPPPSATHQVPPPPKPPTPEDAAMHALLAIENAVKIRARGNPAYVAEIEKLFKTYQGLKARALRPGTPEEGITAMKIAMKKALDLVF